MIRFYRELRKNLYPFVNNTQVDVYASADWQPNDRYVLPMPEADALRPTVSLIATVKNEATNIESWFESLITQIRPPDEIVIVDGGSTDSTFEKLQFHAANARIPLKVYKESGANIARGRNLAIERATGPIIACTDAGCQLPPNWLAALSGPFAANPSLEVVAGYYHALQNDELQRVMAAYFVCAPKEIDRQTFLPSGRSIAFRKDVWRRVGGFPECLTLTAEDTLFDLMLKKQTTRWAFAPEASVGWHLKPTISSLFTQVCSYGRGDGEAGLFPHLYWNRICLSLELCLALLFIMICPLMAFLLQSWLPLLGMLLPGVWIIRRLWQITLRPKWPTGPLQKLKAFSLSATVACTLTMAMAIGFIKGVRLRQQN